MDAQAHGDQGNDESFSVVGTQVEVKVSVDDEETWTRHMINISGELDESVLEVGEFVQLQGEKYRVLVGDYGLRIEPIRKHVGEKKQARRGKKQQGSPNTPARVSGLLIKNRLQTKGFHALNVSSISLLRQWNLGRSTDV